MGGREGLGTELVKLKLNFFFSMYVPFEDKALASYIMAKCFSPKI